MIVSLGFILPSSAECHNFQTNTCQIVVKKFSCFSKSPHTFITDIYISVFPKVRLQAKSNEPQQYYAKWKKADTKHNTSWFHSYRKYRKGKFIETDNI